MVANEIESVLVFGATGNQGGAVVTHLSESEDRFHITGLTRRPDSDDAHELAARDIEVVEGNLNDKDSLREPVRDADAVFLPTNYWSVGYEQQVRQGNNLADVAAEEGVSHVVFSGDFKHDQDTGIRPFDAAWEIDQSLQSKNLPLTVLKPAFMMQNFEPLFEDVIEDGRLAQPVSEGIELQMVDVDDVGRIAAQIFETPDAYAGRRFDLAGDEHTLAEAADVFGEVTGKSVEPFHVPDAEARELYGDDFADMFDYFNEHGYNADIESLRSTFGSGFTTLEEYLREHGWENKSRPAALPSWAKAMGN